MADLRVLVVTTMGEARRRGAPHGTCRHRDKANLQFWWPGLGTELLHGRAFDVVLIGIALDPELRDWFKAHLLRPSRTIQYGPLVVEGQLW